MRHLLAERGLAHVVQVDSAGTAAYHAGEPPDRRSSATAMKRGIELGGRARQFESDDFERFDYVLAMDTDNLDNLAAIVPKDFGGCLQLLRDYDSTAPAGSSVPDPYYGGDRGFEEVVDQCLVACNGLLDHLVARHGLTNG